MKTYQKTKMKAYHSKLKLKRHKRTYAYRANDFTTENNFISDHYRAQAKKNK